MLATVYSLIALGLAGALVWFALVLLQEDAPILRYSAPVALGLLALFLGWFTVKQAIPWRIDMMTPSEIRVRRAWWSQTLNVDDVELIKVENYWPTYGGSGCAALVVLAVGKRVAVFSSDLSEMSGLATDIRKLCGKAVFVDETGQESAPPTANMSRSLRALTRERLRVGWLTLAVAAILFSFGVVSTVLILSGNDWSLRRGAWGLLIAPISCVVISALELFLAIHIIREGRRLASAARQAEAELDDPKVDALAP